MINFILDKIQLRNVRCYGDDMMEMDFPLKNLTVFTGHVGAGKSTILKAVSMALYGEDGGAKGEKLSIDDMINEKSGKNLEIHLYFHSTKDGGNEETKYEIHLFHKHSKYNNKLVFVKNGKDVSLESKTATYELIEKTLIPSGVYHNTYYFTQQCKNFFTSLSNSEQKEIFNSILDLSEYKSYYENAKKQLDEENVQYKVIEQQLKSQEFSLSTFRKMYEDCHNNLEQVKKNDESRLEELYFLTEKLKLEVEKSKSEIPKNVDSDIIKIDMELQKISLNFDNFQSNSHLEIKNDEKNFKDVVVPNLKNKYVKIRLEKSKDLDTELNNLKIEFQKVQSLISNCKKDVDIQRVEEESDFRQDYDKKIGRFVDEINKSKSKIQDYKTKLLESLTILKDNAQKLANDEKRLKSNFENDRTALNVGNKTILEKIEETKSKIDEYEYSLEEPDAVCSLCGQKLNNKDHVQKHLNDLKIQLVELKNKLTENNDKAYKLENEIGDCNKRLTQLLTDFEKDKKKLNDEFTSKEKEVNDYIYKLDSDKLETESEYKKISGDILQKYNNILEEKTSKYKNDLLELNNKINEITTKKNDLDNKLRSEFKVEYSNLESGMKKKHQDILNQVDKQAILYKENKEKLDKEMNDLKDVKKKIDDINSQIRSMEDSILKYEKEIETINSSTFHEELIASLKTAQEMIDTTLVKVNDSKTKLNKSTKNIEILTFWKTAFSDSGIKSMLIDSAIPHMNECVGQELDRVAPGKFTVSFDTVSETKSGKVKDKFSVNILNNEKGSTGHKKLSGGEKRIIDLCCMSSLRSLAEKLYGKRFHHIFYDEILDSLDDECKQQFCTNVKLQSQSGCNVTMVTHDLPEDVDPDRVFPF